MQLNVTVIEMKKVRISIEIRVELGLFRRTVHLPQMPRIYATNRSTVANRRYKTHFDGKGRALCEQSNHSFVIVETLSA